MNPLFRNVCFTVNNYTDEERLRILNWDGWSYVIIGEEIGEEGTSHLQGYGELTSRMRSNRLFSFFNGRAHCEERKGTQREAINYCAKDGLFEERGRKRAQGSRRDLDRTRQLAIEVGMRGVTRVGNMQQIKVAEKFLEYNEESRDWKPTVYWLWGKTGVGKSKAARQLCNDDVYVKNTADKWFVGYDAHECCILDDFREDWMKFADFLSLIDRYECRIENKGGKRQFLAKIIVITCPWKPEDCFRNRGIEDIEQVLRRIDAVIEVVPDVPEVGGGNTEVPPTPSPLGL